MKASFIKISILTVAAGLLTLAVPFSASAHVVVRPSEVAAATFQTFTIGVPNEKDLPTTSLKLVMPEGLEHVSPTQKTGWTIKLETDGSGENAQTRSIMWTGGTVGVGLRDDFTFSAKVPATPTDLQWNAYQTYSDGTVVAWDSDDKEMAHGGTSGPFSVTSVVNETAEKAAIKKAEAAASDAKSSARRSLFVAVAGVLLGLGGVALATKKSR